MPTRRDFLKLAAMAAVGAALPGNVSARTLTANPSVRQIVLAAAVPGGTLDPLSIPKYADPLVIPPAMPRTTKLPVKMGKNIDYYEIAVRQFQQHILPASMHKPTTVWGYGSVNHPAKRSTTRRSPSRRSGSSPYGSSGSTSWSTRTATTCRTCLPSTRPCTGPIRPAGAGHRIRGDWTPHLTRVPCRSSPTSTARTPRGERRLSRGLVPARGQQHPRQATPRSAPSTTQFKGEFRGRQRGRTGSRARRSSSTRTTSGPPPCGTTTTRWA